MPGSRTLTAVIFRDLSSAWPLAGLAAGPMSFAVRVPDQRGALGGVLTDTLALAAALPVSHSLPPCTSPLPAAAAGQLVPGDRDLERSTGEQACRLVRRLGPAPC